MPVDEQLLTTASKLSPQAISTVSEASRQRINELFSSFFVCKTIFCFAQDVNYIQQNTTSTTNTLESDCTPSLTHATRVSPATVSLYERERKYLRKVR